MYLQVKSLFTAGGGKRNLTKTKKKETNIHTADDISSKCDWKQRTKPLVHNTQIDQNLLKLKAVDYTEI